MNITQDQKINILSKVSLIMDDAALVEARVEGGDFDPRALGETADQIITWATQLSEALYDVEVENE